MFRFVIGLCLALSMMPTQAAKAVKKEAATAAEKISWLKEVGKAYHEAKSVEMAVEKSVKSFFKPKPAVSKGKLTLKQQNMRLELDGAEKSTVVIKDGRVKVLNYMPEESGFKTNVIETSFEKQKGSGLYQEMFTALITGKDIEKAFIVEKSERKEDQLRFDLKPKKEIEEFERVELVVADKTYRIQEISMWDQYDNMTKFLISDITFNKEVDDSIFTEKTPKDALVEKF